VIQRAIQVIYEVEEQEIAVELIGQGAFIPFRREVETLTDGVPGKLMVGSPGGSLTRGDPTAEVFSASQGTQEVQNCLLVHR
jgi:hypothetical protein